MRKEGESGEGRGKREDGIGRRGEREDRIGARGKRDGGNEKREGRARMG